MLGAMDPISVQPVAGAFAPAAAAPSASRGGGFSEVLSRAIDGVDAAQKRADTLSREFQLENPDVSLEETMVAVQKANISFQALVQARNKIVAAYQEIMNMPV
jgi:flagellar hook-basal body complex protein FliE